jgi:hypothetical protein
MSGPLISYIIEPEVHSFNISGIQYSRSSVQRINKTETTEMAKNLIGHAENFENCSESAV